MHIKSIGFRKRLALTACLAVVLASLEGFSQGVGDAGNSPQTMRLCTNHCDTLVWANDHYDGKADGNGNIVSRYTVSSWKPDDISFTGIAVKRGPFGVETRAVFKGKIAPGEGSIANPKVDMFTNSLPIIKGAPYTLTWSEQTLPIGAAPPQPVLAVSTTPTPVGAPMATADPLPRWLYECDVLPTRKNCSRTRNLCDQLMPC